MHVICILPLIHSRGVEYQTGSIMRYEPRKLTTEAQTILREGAEKQGATYQMNQDLEHFQPGLRCPKCTKCCCLRPPNPRACRLGRGPRESLRGQDCVPIIVRRACGRLKHARAPDAQETGAVV